MPLIFLLVFNLIGSSSNLDQLRDFGAFLAAGTAAASGRNPYAVSGADPNLNPPISLLVFEPLNRLDPLVARRAWYVLSLACMFVALILLVRAYPPPPSSFRVLWVMAFAGMWFTLQMGQIYTLLLVLATGAWLFLATGRRVPAGLLLGLLIAVKPQLALWPLLLLLTGAYLAGLVAYATAALLTLIPALVYGPGIYIAWLHATELVSTAFSVNASLPGFFARLDLPWLGFTFALLLVLACCALVRRHRPPLEATSALALVASLLASPVAWIGYTSLLAPVFLSRPWTRALRLAALLLLIPAPLVWAAGDRSYLWRVLSGAVYCSALLLALSGVATPLLSRPDGLVQHGPKETDIAGLGKLSERLRRAKALGTHTGRR